MAEELYTDDYGNVYGEMITSPVGRAQFVKLVTPDVFNGKPKYKLVLLFDKKDETVTNQLKLITNAALVCVNQRFPDVKDKKGETVSGVPAKYKSPILDGDDDKMSGYQGFPGCWYLQCGTGKPPSICGRKEEALGPEAIMSGMLVRAVIKPLATNTGVAWQLQVLQFVKDDGIRYYGGPDPKSLLGAIEGDDAEPEAVTPPKEEAVKSGKRNLSLANL